MGALRCRRRARRLVIVLTAAIWTIGPWVPAAVCAATHLAAAEQAVATPDCHGHHEASATDAPATDASAPERHASGCCSDFTENCCLEAAHIDGAPSFGKSLDAPVQLALVAVLPVTAFHVPACSALPTAHERARGSTHVPSPFPLRL
ncbi:MAG: hypothetical protein E4H03_05385 [Myxococcales bacterium]|nr:MAG: hypothetical protein E4H03_05385 [Myxococcales bacterium]